MSSLEVNENYESTMPSVLSPVSDNKERYEPFISIEGVKGQLNFLLGDVLTIVDAAISDVTQRKAIKDLVKQKFWDRCDHLESMLYNTSNGTASSVKKSA